MANNEASSTPDNGANHDDNSEYPEHITRNLYKIVKKVMNDKVFNCKSCGTFFKTAVYSVHGTGTVCQNCLTRNSNWKGERLEFFDAFLADLPAVPCSNAAAGCEMVVLMPADLQHHLADCEYRPVNCISPGCAWQSKQDDLVKHFEEKHRADVISEKTAFNLNLAGESFMVARLLVKSTDKYFLRIRREKNSKQVLYHAFKVERSHVHTVSVTHCCESTGVNLTKSIRTELLNMIDKTCALNGMNLMVLKEISGDTNQLSLTVEVTKSKHEEMFSCSGCKETMRKPIYKCDGNHSVCGSCFIKASSQCPVCWLKIKIDSRNCSLENLTSDIYYPCTHRRLGCGVTLLGNAIDQHESNCTYRLQSCRLPNCSFEYVDKETFMQHVSLAHEDVSQGIIHKIKYKVSASIDSQSFFNYVCCDGNLFQLKSTFTIAVGHEYLDYFDVACEVRILTYDHYAHFIDLNLRESLTEAYVDCTIFDKKNIQLTMFKPIHVDTKSKKFINECFLIIHIKTTH